MTHCRPSRSPSRRRGVTLAESLIATVVLAVSAAAVGQALVASYQAEAAIRRGEAAAEVGGVLLGHVTAKPIDVASAAPPDPLAWLLGVPGDVLGTIAGLLREPEAVAAAAGVGDLDGYTDQVTPELPAGDPAAGEYRRRVDVDRLAAPDGPAHAAGRFARVVVTVTDPAGHDHEFARLMTPGGTE